MRAFNDKLFGAGTPTAAEVKTLNESNANTNTITDTDKTNLATLTDNSMADTLHRHSELSASDGTPDAGVSVNAEGQCGIGVAPNASYALALPASGLTITSGGTIDYGGGNSRIVDGGGSYYQSFRVWNGGSVAEQLQTYALGIRLPTIPIYADNAAAAAGGLTANSVYKTVTGELRIVV